MRTLKDILTLSLSKGEGNIPHIKF
jgi:hypothetical protein